MPASKMNYLVIYKGESQVYGAASKKVAFKGPLPDGVEIEDKTIMFSTYNPETGELSLHALDQEEIIEGYEEWLVEEEEKKKAKEEKERQKRLEQGTES